MTTIKEITRCMQRLGRVSCRQKVLHRASRCASTLAKNEQVAGQNGEKIFPSVFGNITVPDVTIPEYVWRYASRFPNHVALECAVSGKKYTYSQARDAANYVARSLLNMGLKKGDVVGLVAPNYPETILACLGMLEAELIVTTVNPYYTEDEISKQLKSSGAKAVITQSEIASTVNAAAKRSLSPNSPLIVIEDGVRPLPEGAIPFKDLVARGKSLPVLKTGGLSQDDLAILPYSSGTTGLPKGVMLTHKNIVGNLEMISVTGAGHLWQPTTESFQEVVPLFLPFFHIYGLNAIAFPRLAEGCRLVTLPKFMPDLFIKVFENSKPTALFCVPPIVLFLVSSPSIKKSHMERIQIAVSGAAPIAKPDVDRFYEKFDLNSDKLKFCQGYGLTESSPVNFMELTGRKFSSIGKNVAGCDARLVDHVTNKDVTGPGQTGELWVRGPHIMKGYLNNETATNETIVGDGWLKTGDIAYYDEENDFYITDRLKELIKVKGFQVPPAELEALLRMHPAVEEAGVIGIPDERCGELPKAFVMLKKGMKCSEKDIQDFVKGKVSEYKELQGGVTFVDSIPISAAGKILRSQLKKQNVR